MAADNWLVEGVRSPCIKTLECSLPAFCSLLWPFFFFIFLLLYIHIYIRCILIFIFILITILVNKSFFFFLNLLLN